MKTIFTYPKTFAGITRKHSYVKVRKKQATIKKKNCIGVNTTSRCT